MIRRFIEFHGGRTHPKDIGAAEIRAFVSRLAVEQNFAATIQNVAFSALLFLYGGRASHRAGRYRAGGAGAGGGAAAEVFTRKVIALA